MNPFPTTPAQWSPPPELLRSLPRPVAWKARGIALAVLAIALGAGAVAAGTGLSTVAGREARETRQLQDQGQNVEATITRVWRSRDKEKTPRVAYQFEFDGRTWQGESTAPRATWESLREGSPLTVRFVAANPLLNHPAGWHRSDMPMWLPYLLSASLAIGALLPVFALRREKRLLAEGRAAAAVVTGYGRTKQGKLVKYEFRAPDGAKISGRSGPVKTWPPLAATVCILYDPDNPRRNALYPLCLVRLAR